MNVLLANLNLLYVKLHNLHYNVVGPNFLATHVFLEKEYDVLHVWIDEVAETLKMTNQQPLGSMKEYLEIATIKEIPSKDYTSKEAYEFLKADYTMLLEHIVELKKSVSEVEGLLLDDLHGEIVKKLWFINSTIK